MRHSGSGGLHRSTPPGARRLRPKRVRLHTHVGQHAANLQCREQRTPRTAAWPDLRPSSATAPTAVMRRAGPQVRHDPEHDEELRN
eukprot:8224231-Alexandrium_andersonii.AAC.1